ncbi:MAG TPA: hypothetical protein VK504_13805 [Vicinamibacterales bacterium]|nr:hypothetical protein [Vicinamibacterales bacterium]
MKTQIHLTSADLCAVEATGSGFGSLGLQHWTAGHSDANGDSITMYLSPEQARDIAAHFAQLADAMDVRLAAHQDAETVAVA